MRVKEARKILEDHALDGLLVTTLDNVHWLSGFTGSAGIVVLTRGKGFFLTDGRYTTQAGEEVHGFAVREYRKRVEGIAQVVAGLKLRRVGFEGHGVSYAELREIKKAVGRTRLVPLGEDIEAIRARKDAPELQALSRAIDIAARSFREAARRISPGARERDLAFHLEVGFKKYGSGTLPFEVIVASGPRSALPHAKPSERRIKKGDYVIMDFGASWKGYSSDTTRTFIVGHASKRQREVYRAVKDAHDKVIEKFRPGMKGKEVDLIARNHLKSLGLARYFRHGLGHGIGLNVHEAPMLSPLSDSRIEEGMVVTVEPGVYIPGWGGVRIEDMVRTTRHGFEVMTGSMRVEEYADA